mgnify:CR=1 FL=1
MIVAIATESCTVNNLAPYVPGQFYKRELPGIIEVLKYCTHEEITAIIVDGYVILDDHGKIGLGGHLYKALDRSIPIIGVAWRAFMRSAGRVGAI